MTGIGCTFDAVIEQLRNKISLQVILGLRMGTLVVYFVFEVVNRRHFAHPGGPAPHIGKSGN